MKKETPPASSPVQAVETIYRSLEPLDPAARRRVITSVLSLLGENELPVAMPAAAVAVPPPQGGETAKPAVGGRKLAPVELMQEKKPATNPQKIALFAYYREKYEGLARFSRADLKTYFAKAKEAPPANYDRDFGSAVKAGWIHEDEADSYLTSKGLEAVEAGFDGKAAPRGTHAKARPSAK